MDKLNAAAYQEVRRWMYRNARPLDLARWQYHFEGGSREAVLAALSTYQNADGGFGLGLEADNWNPHSSPYTTGVAAHVLKEIEFTDASHPMLQGMLTYLDNTWSKKGWPFTIPGNSDYPHAPWWTSSEATDAAYGYYPTGILVGFILNHGNKASLIYQRALTLADQMMEKVLSDEPIDVHEAGCYCTFLEDVKSANLTQRIDCDRLEARLSTLVDGAIERDPAKWPVYSMRPSMYIDSPTSPFYKGNEAVVEDELAYILRSRMPGGVWNISWQWADYPNEFAISANWWRGDWAIHNIRLLKSFGRVDIV